MYVKDTLTTLTEDLKEGDTVIHLEDTSNLQILTEEDYYYPYSKGLIFWNYEDSTGYKYPSLSYSKNNWNDLFDYSGIDKENNMIT